MFGTRELILGIGVLLSGGYLWLAWEKPRSLAGEIVAQMAIATFVLGGLWLTVLVGTAVYQTLTGL